MHGIVAQFGDHAVWEAALLQLGYPGTLVTQYPEVKKVRNELESEKTHG